LLPRARELWRELEGESDWRLLTLNGGLMIGSAGSAAMSNVELSARRFDLPHEVLDAATSLPIEHLDLARFLA
jgi:sarcosine oxidase